MRQRNNQKAVDSFLLGSIENMSYKNYCNRRTAKKGQESEESHCCPLRIPIIGPILFSLFVFSPFLIPSSDSENIPDLASNHIIDEEFPPGSHSLQKSKIKDKNRRNIQAQNEDNLRK
jgi:hypothetical protein